MKRLTEISFIFLLLVVLGCGSQKKAVNNQPDASSMVGNDTDDHGCKASAGYIWSDIRQECIRLWEAGIRLSSIPSSDPSVSSFVIFAPDSSSVELFLPADASMLLEKVADKPVWKNGRYSLDLESGHWVIKKSGKPLYQSDK